MAGADFVAGDWGTSHLRLFLCDDRVGCSNRHGPGAAERHFAEIFDSLVAKWTPHPDELQAVLCGMVGSTIGWIQAPYLACRARPEDIATACARCAMAAFGSFPAFPAAIALMHPILCVGRRRRFSARWSSIRRCAKGVGCCAFRVPTPSGSCWKTVRSSNF